MLKATDSSVFSRKTLLIIALVFNIALLGLFKYMDFFIDNINFVFGSHIGLLHIVLPLGISFFTITQIAFLVDCYEGLVKERNPLNYALFVTFFPHLIAGPILHHKEMMPQFADTKNKILNYENLAIGLFLFAIGLFKKTVIADSFAPWADAGFDAVDNGLVLNLFESWATILSYAFQLYFDFSGYSDMAVALGLMFNVKLPINFNSPFKALNISDFWRRWHMSLTNFLTTYIYTPMIRVFQNPSFAKMMLATFVTFFIAGIWHGAGWGFVIFGALHGVALVVNQYWKKKLSKILKVKIPKIISWFLTFIFVLIAWVFFRAESVQGAFNLLKGMFSTNIVLPISLETRLNFLMQYGIAFGRWASVITEPSYVVFSSIVFGFVVCLGFKNSMQIIANFKPTKLMLLAIVFLSVIALLCFDRTQQFLYFNF
nr:MBOAT family O-acyltransferase [Helicobacter enhydrae]